MEYIYHIGNCPACRYYGRMEILFNTTLKEIFVMCDECCLEFYSYDDYKNGNGIRVSFKNTEIRPYIRPATLKEIKGTEWYAHIIDIF